MAKNTFENFERRMTLLLDRGDSLMKAITQITNLDDAEMCVRAVLMVSTTRLGSRTYVDAALQKFYDLLENTPEGRTVWTEHLSQFIYNMYEDRQCGVDADVKRTLETWINKFSILIFGGTVNCDISVFDTPWKLLLIRDEPKRST